MRIVSDGTPQGTALYDDKGHKIEGIITKIIWNCVAGQSKTEAVVSLAVIEADITTPVKTCQEFHPIRRRTKKHSILTRLRIWWQWRAERKK